MWESVRMKKLEDGHAITLFSSNKKRIEQVYTSQGIRPSFRLSPQKRHLCFFTWLIVASAELSWDGNWAIHLQSGIDKIDWLSLLCIHLHLFTYFYECMKYYTWSVHSIKSESLQNLNNWITNITQRIMRDKYSRIFIIFGKPMEYFKE